LARNFVEKQVYKLDGKAAERIVGLITSLVAAKVDR